MVDDARLHQVLIVIRSNFNSLHQDLHKNGFIWETIETESGTIVHNYFKQVNDSARTFYEIIPNRVYELWITRYWYISPCYHPNTMIHKFTVIPHYTYPVLKMLGPNGVITAKGDLRQSCTCDIEGNNLTKSQLIQAESNDMKEAFKQSHLEAWICRMSPNSPSRPSWTLIT